MRIIQVATSLTWFERLTGKKAGQCIAGYFCELGAASPNPNVVRTDEIKAGLCDPGYYCLEKTIEPIPCPNATFNPNPGGKDITDCKKCPAGQECRKGKKICQNDPYNIYSTTYIVKISSKVQLAVIKFE